MKTFGEIAVEALRRATTPCPRCGKNMLGKYPALSRRDNKTLICSECGTEEAMYDFAMSGKFHPIGVEVYQREHLFIKKLKK